MIVPYCKYCKRLINNSALQLYKTNHTNGTQLCTVKEIRVSEGYPLVNLFCSRECVEKYISFIKSIEMNIIDLTKPSPLSRIRLIEFNVKTNTKEFKSIHIIEKNKFNAKKKIELMFDSADYWVVKQRELNYSLTSGNVPLLPAYNLAG